MTKYYSRRQKTFIKSRGKNIYVEFIYPKKIPAPAIIIAHGLRSYFPGFMDMFAKSLVKAGYIAVKFHFLGTGKSEGKFEDKSTANMLQNLKDVIAFVKKQPVVKDIGILGRSNGGSLAVLCGQDARIKAYVFLAASAYYSLPFQNYISKGKVKGKFVYHKSFKRSHTKGEGRLPLNFLKEIAGYNQALLRGIGRIREPMIYFQSTKDEAVFFRNGDLEYYKKHWHGPKKTVIIQGGSHSFKDHKRFVINESVKWLKKYLPAK